jgi:aspartokinase/homoserine dehydrogenase 2
MSSKVGQLDNTFKSDASLTLHKFGGSSLADPACYQRVANLLLQYGQPNDLVVVSAAGKTTNQLLALIEMAAAGVDYHVQLTHLINYQRELIDTLLSEPQETLSLLNNELEALGSWLCYETVDQYTANSIVACGEVWSSRLLAALLNEKGRASCAIDARQFLVARGAISPIIDEAYSQQLFNELCNSKRSMQRVITGFICRNVDNKTLTLGRNGSDYSATLIAQLAGVKAVNVWTDVAGVFSADPNLIHEAALIEQLSLVEAEELARLGNPVLHHRTLQPLAKDNIALRVRSSFTPDAAFTEIGRRLGHVGDCIVNGAQDINVYTFDNNDQNEQIVAALAEHGFFPLISTQHNTQLLLVLPLEMAVSFESFLSTKIDGDYQCDVDCGVISLLDAGVSWYRKLFAKLFIKESNWPIVLSENGLSLSVIVPAKRVNILAYLLHQKIYSPAKSIGVVLMGAGNIGQQWLSLFNQQQLKLENTFNMSLPLVGIARSCAMLIDYSGIDVHSWQSAFTDNSMAIEKSDICATLATHPFDDLVVLDVSADQGLTDTYPEFLDAGFHVISANKLAGSAPLAFYKEIKQLAYSNNSKWLYNASVGAGLPILHCINDLYRSGDTIESISGVFSGTLSWLFEHYDNSVPFSTLLTQALSLGITEPDPRDDLSGKDKQRKLLILARECGFDIELEDIELHSMVPESLRTISLPEFLERCGELDEVMSTRFEQAKLNNQVIRYVAEFNHVDGQFSASVGLKILDNSHPFASLTPSDNVFLVKSEWYQDNPLVIRGPGAGREVTAAAIESDLYSLLKELQ